MSIALTLHQSNKGNMITQKRKNMKIKIRLLLCLPVGFLIGSGIMALASGTTEPIGLNCNNVCMGNVGEAYDRCVLGCESGKNCGKNKGTCLGCCNTACLTDPPVAGVDRCYAMCYGACNATTEDPEEPG
jgi:hypothetical protein